MQNKDNKEKRENNKVSQPKLIINLLIVLIVTTFLQVYLFTIIGAQNTEEYNYRNPEKVEYSVFYDTLEDGKVDTVYIDANLSAVRYTLLNEETSEMTLDERNEVPDSEKEWYQTDYPGYEDFRKDVLALGAQVQIRSWATGGFTLATFATLLNIALTVFFIVFLYSSMKRMSSAAGGGILGFNSTGIITTDVPDVKYTDIIGHDEVIQDIQHAMKVMQDAEKYKDLGVKPPRGILLVGPPGTGKTMIAKACANEAGLNFLPVNSSSFIDKFVGQGASTVRNTFKQAKEKQPCILFFDEIDSIGSKRSGIDGGGNSEYKQTLDALLQELDGFNTSDKIYIMAATNMYESLDPALVRPGRFDRKIMIGLPRDAKTRVQLLEHYLGKFPLADDVNLDNIAKQLSGMSGADIAQVVNEAKLIAIQNDDKELKSDYLEESIDKTYFHGNRTKAEYEHDKKIVSYHESGHALSMLINKMPIARMSVIPNTSGVGGMVVNSDKESHFVTKQDYINRIKSLYAGRIAEELIFGLDNITTGASNDLVVATNCVDEFVNKYGFDNDFSYLFIDKDRSVGGFNSGYDRTTYNRMNEIAKKLYNESKQELQDNIDILEKLANIVYEEETLDSDEITSIYEKALAERNGEVESESELDSEEVVEDSNLLSKSEVEVTEEKE